ncbi:MAG: ATP-binding protein [Treponema sp.]|nr:ATP-binding protein [Treponema sp.]
MRSPPPEDGPGDGELTETGVLADLAGLSVFSDLRDQPLFKALEELLAAAGRPDAAGSYGKAAASIPALIRAWSGFVRALCGFGGLSFHDAAASLVTASENPFTLAAEKGLFPEHLKTPAENDLSRLNRVASLDVAALGRLVSSGAKKAGLTDRQSREFEQEALALSQGGQKAANTGEVFSGDDWAAALPAFAAYIRSRGAGSLGLYRSFRWVSNDGSGTMQPVANPDPIRLSDLSGYEDQRSVVVSNTLRFIEGKPASNLLLYGDRGTGKSATVKAVCAEYADQGLRILELRKEALPSFPAVLECLASRGLRFVVFIDDLSFETLDDSFMSLKALLEGGAGTRPANTVIYATSNRRHLVKENRSDRVPGGDVRDFDTMQEQLSLADRFGLTVIYAAPNQEEYLAIAEFIARKRGLLKTAAEDPSPEAEEQRRLFRENCLRWERWFNGRSPRTAAQYADWLEGGGKFPWEGT